MSRPAPRDPAPAAPPTISPINLSDPIRPIADVTPIRFTAARDEWTSFVVRIENLPPDGTDRLRMSPPAVGRSMASFVTETSRILPLPARITPAYVRHTGLHSAARTIPMALLPLARQGDGWSLAASRTSAGSSSRDILLWIDIHVPIDAAAGEYQASCELSDRDGRRLVEVPIQLHVFDFTLPSERHLRIVGRVNPDRLAALDPEAFGESLVPHLINRRDPHSARAVETLDRLMRLAHENRVELEIPELRPGVKWPAVGPPEIDWSDFNPLVAPWLSGSAFADRVPAGFWPLPAARGLDRHDARAQLAYWGPAIHQFDQLGRLDQAPVTFARPEPGETTSDLCDRAAELLGLHPRVRVIVPVDDRTWAARGPESAADRRRVVTLAPGLISSDDAAPALTPGLTHWLDADDAGLVPYQGAGCDERDVRLWAWLAFLRRADLILSDRALPAENSPTEATETQNGAWFCPGSWFGVDEPVPTLQLKWFRRAEQDYEYLRLARERGETVEALQMARLLTRPIEIPPGVPADPAFALLTGTFDQAVWDQARELLARTILLRKPGESPDPNQQRALYIQTLQWAEPQERPMLMAREAQWILEPPGSAGALNLHFTTDIYNAADVRPGDNLLHWDWRADSMWRSDTDPPARVPRLRTYHIQPATISARFDLNRLSPDAARPLSLSFINGYNNAITNLTVRLPVAESDRRDAPPRLDGRLDDWSDADALQNGPMVLMTDRPSVQRAELRRSAFSSKVYSGWDKAGFYLAFALQGLSPPTGEARNDAEYQVRRAFGEDLCEALIQPVRADNSLGPVLHILFKPGAAMWVERRAAAPNSDWHSVSGAVRYATATVAAENLWRGEAAIPWTLIDPDSSAPPALLRFNFCRHLDIDCESSSWCGPVDFGRDERLMGALVLRSPM